MLKLTAAILITGFYLTSTTAMAKALRYVHGHQHEKTLINCEADERVQFPGGTIEDAGYRLMRIDGQLYKNWTYVAIPTVVHGEVLAKIWGPGRDPSNAIDASTTVPCTDPNPAPEPKPKYYPDTY